MAGPVRDILFVSRDASDTLRDPQDLERTTATYLSHLAGLPSSALDVSEPKALAASSHSLLVSIQALSKRSHKSIVDSVGHHSVLQTSLPVLRTNASDLRDTLPKLDSEALRFSTTFGKTSENDVLARRRAALLLLRNVDRLVDLLEMPALLSSAISSTPANHSAALDLNGHIRRIHSIYPESPLVTSISRQADGAIRQMAADLVFTLRGSGLKLATALRAMSWLRRVISDLAGRSTGRSHSDTLEKSLGTMFLACRVGTLSTTLSALEPLRHLAEEEKSRQSASGGGSAWSGGQQTERYLKRYIEIFREHSFGILSMFKSVFPSTATRDDSTAVLADPLQPLPSSLSTFALHLVEMLLGTLRTYLPVIRDRTSRESIITQVLYCATSLGRLGGDFTVLLSGFVYRSDTEPADDGWADAVKRHRLLTGRLGSVLEDYKALGARVA